MKMRLAVIRKLILQLTLAVFAITFLPANTFSAPAVQTEIVSGHESLTIKKLPLDVCLTKIQVVGLSGQIFSSNVYDLSLRTTFRKQRIITLELKRSLMAVQFQRAHQFTSQLA